MKCMIGLRGLMCKAVAAAGVLAVAMGAGCSRKVVTVPVESVRTEEVRADTSALLERVSALMAARMESVARRDSVSERVREVLVLSDVGDTLRRDVDRDVYHGSDTDARLSVMESRYESMLAALWARLESVSADSLAEPYPVERELSRWEQVKMDTGGVALGVLGLAVVALGVWGLVRIKK